LRRQCLRHGRTPSALDPAWRDRRDLPLFSAFLVNDAICLVLAPLVLELTLALGRRPVPNLLAVAMASNVRSTATITGNPQNTIIGSFSHIPYTKFALALGPVALVGPITPGRSSRSSIAPSSLLPRDLKRHH
jgi:hypothetical protein